MKSSIAIISLWFFSALALAQHSATVEGQVAAYNSHNAEHYASFFHDDIEVYNYPDSPMTSGKGALIEATTSTFAKHKPTSEILNTIELNDKVITLERATFKVQNTRQEMEVVKIYQFQSGKIRRMTFMK